MNLQNQKINYIKGRVSAVVPVYNGEEYLSHILDSILEQTYPQIEMILADDGSSDGTLSVAESYRERFAARGYDYRIVQADHKSASAAINHGLPYVTGEYLIWPDSDDRLESDSVEKRVRFLQNHPQYQCVRSLAYYYSAETGEQCPADEKAGDLSREELFWDILESRTFVCCGCYMLRSERFFEIYPERHIPEYDVGQNFQMLLPFMFYHRCPTMQEQLYGVCVREGSHSRRKLTKQEECRKYRDYEQLVDEITSICQIKDREAKRRIARWKLNRRYHLAVKYGNREQRIRAAWRMRKYGQRGIWHEWKDLLWICLKDTWILKHYTYYSDKMKALSKGSDRKRTSSVRRTLRNSREPESWWSA